MGALTAFRFSDLFQPRKRLKAMCDAKAMTERTGCEMLIVGELQLFHELDSLESGMCEQRVKSV